MAKQSTTRAKGDGSLYQEANGRWVGSIDIGIKNGKRSRKRVRATTQAACRKKLRAIQLEMEQGLVTDSSTLTSWTDYWLDEICPHRIAAKTLYEYRNKVRLYVTPVIGKVQLKALRPEHVRQVHKFMRDQGLAENTVRQTHRILFRCLKVAEYEGKMKRNPAALTDAPSTVVKPTPILTVGQAKQVLAGATNRRELARLTCALVLGMRQGEALALKWDDIDFTNETLLVDESVGRVPGVGLVVKDPKTRAGRRTIPLPSAVTAIFKSWYAEAAGESEFVFPGLHGGPEGQKRDWEVWKTALERVGVPHVKLHGARGTAASLLLEMGVPDRVIADILGHANVRVTQTHYLHSDARQRGQALDGLAAELGVAPLGLT